MMTKKIAAAITKRMPAKLIGGRSRSPTLIASQVDPQITQRPAKAVIAFHRTSASGTVAGSSWRWRAGLLNDRDLGSRHGGLVCNNLIAQYCY